MDKVKSYIEKNKDRFLNELFELLRIPSISAQSDHKPDMTRCAEWLAASLMKAGADHAEVLPTEGNPVVFAERIVDPKAKTVLVYGHYDVMPVDPVDEWRTSPFEPVVKDGRIWCRGADDDKGQLFMHAKAFEAMCATDSLPCNVKFLLEGEEEIGSPSLYKFCADNKKMLKADIILVSDTSMISMQIPLDHLRSARSDLYGGRSDRPQQGPALRPVRRCGGQSGQCPGPHGGFAHR